jgi:hypothetical protein
LQSWTEMLAHSRAVRSRVSSSASTNVAQPSLMMCVRLDKVKVFGLVPDRLHERALKILQGRPLVQIVDEAFAPLLGGVRSKAFMDAATVSRASRSFSTRSRPYCSSYVRMSRACCSASFSMFLLDFRYKWLFAKKSAWPNTCAITRTFCR